MAGGYLFDGRNGRLEGKRCIIEIDTRAYQAHGLGRSRRESADCNSRMNSRERLGRGLG